jgi:hypothetical protein
MVVPSCQIKIGKYDALNVWASPKIKRLTHRASLSKTITLIVISS